MIWPKSNFLYNLSLIDKYIKSFFLKSDKIEKNFLIFSSARSSIYNILKCFNFNRDHIVAVGPYTNECIYNSVGAISNPVLSKFIKKKPDVQLIYHQSGYEVTSKLKSFTIEDSADSYIASKKSLFPNNGNFEIISIPKISNFNFGSIVFCQNLFYLNKLKKFQLKQTKNFLFNINLFMTLIHLNIFDFKSNSKYLIKSVPESLVDIIFLVYQLTKNYHKDIQNKISEIIKYVYIIPDKNRLPNSLLLKIDISRFHLLKKKFPFLYLRHFNISRDFCLWNLKKFIFLPIHQDISLDNIVQLKKYLDE